MWELAFWIGSGIEIVERVDIPEELIPADAKVEIDAKMCARSRRDEGRDRAEMRAEMRVEISPRSGRDESRDLAEIWPR